MDMRKSLLLGLTLVMLVGFVAASSIDVSVGSSEEYSIGSDVTFSVRLVDDNGVLISESIDVVLSDALEKKVIEMSVSSNEDVSVLIEDDFMSGVWNIKASYGEDVGRGIFNVAANSDVEFVIDGDELMIRNVGNVRYTKTVIITIAGEDYSYVQNIGVGEEKVLRLLVPEGSYDIKITDGEKSLTKSDIQLFGTGNVVDAIDPGLVGYVGLGGASDPEDLGENFFSSDKTWLAVVFVAAIFGIGILFFIQKRVGK